LTSKIVINLTCGLVEKLTPLKYANIEEEG
jgi:hypothetical protein